MKISRKASFPGILLALAIISLLSSFFVYFMFKNSPYYYSRNIVVDFTSFVLGLVARPFILYFCTLSDSYWNSEIRLEGLRDRIDIYRDDYGLPYVYAKNDFDVYFAQGFLHATDRPFQMEIMRLLSVGKLAEVLGEEMLNTDMMSRSCISEDIILKKLVELPDDCLENFAAYADGISAGFTNLPATPIEFLLLGHSPKKIWEISDVVAVATLLSVMLNRGLTGDIVRSVLKKNLGIFWKEFDFGYPDGIPYLNPDGPRPSIRDLDGNLLELPKMDAIDDSWAKIRPGDSKDIKISERVKMHLKGKLSVHSKLQEPLSDENLEKFNDWLEDTQRAYSQPSDKGNNLAARWGGSNAIAVSGRFTKSGRPIVAGDPHLEVAAPGFWYPMFIFSDGSTKSETEDYKYVRSIGGSSVGTTGIFVGHNEYAGWSQTVAHTDIEDLYIVDLDSTGRYYYYDGVKYPLKIEQHVINIRGKSEPFIYVARYTHHGPLFSDALPNLRVDLKPHQALAFASVALRSPLPAEWAKKMVFGKSWVDYIQMGEVGQQNEFVTVWGSVDGNIGAAIAGAIPKRPRTPDEALYRDGSKSAHDWDGLIPVEQIPAVMNPISGFITTANCKLADDPDDIYGRVYVPGHRMIRLTQLVEEAVKARKLDIDDFLEIQTDLHSINGCEFKDYVVDIMLKHFRGVEIDYTIINACSDEGLYSDMGRYLLDVFEDWDCRMNVKSIAASIYEVWMQFVMQDLFAARKISINVLYTILGGGFHSTWLPRTEALNHWRINLLRVLKNEHKIVTGVITPRRLLCRSAAHALEFLRMQSGAVGGEGWRWGALRNRFFDHLIGKAAPTLRYIFSVGPYTWGGNFGTVKAHHFQPHVLDLSDADSSRYSEGLDTTSLRVIMDTNDWSRSLWAFYPGISGWIGSKHFANMGDGLTEGSEKMVPMLWRDPDIFAAAKTHLKLIPKISEKDVYTQL